VWCRKRLMKCMPRCCGMFDRLLSRRVGSRSDLPANPRLTRQALLLTGFEQYQTKGFVNRFDEMELGFAADFGGDVGEVFAVLFR